MNGYCGDYNIDRIIISYHVRTRTVETVYVTEHGGEVFGGFSPDRTYEISFEIIQVLQSPQLGLTTFLTQMGYYSDFQLVQANNIDGTHHSEDSYQQMFNIRSMARTMQSNIQLPSEALDLQPGVNIESFSYDQQVHHTVNKTSRPATNYSDRSFEAIKRARALMQSYWKQIYKGKSVGSVSLTVLYVSLVLQYLHVISISIKLIFYFCKWTIKCITAICMIGKCHCYSDLKGQFNQITFFFS